MPVNNNGTATVAPRKKVAVLYALPDCKSLRSYENAYDQWVDEDEVLHVFLEDDGVFSLHPPVSA